MPYICTKISVAGFTDAEIAEGMPYFKQYLSERPWLINPTAEWNSEQQLLLVTIETEGDEPKIESEATFDEVWDCVIAAFSFSSDKISFNILGAEQVA